MPDEIQIDKTEKIRHLGRSIDYIENRIPKLNSDSRIFIAWQFVLIGFVSSFYSMSTENLDSNWYSELFSDLLFAISVFYIFSSLLVIIMFINCIRPVKFFPQEMKMNVIFGSLFALDSIKQKNSEATNLMWPLSDTPKKPFEYRESFDVKLQSWSTYQEENELASTLSVLHRLIAIKMSWYRVAVLCNRVQLFSGLSIYGLIGGGSIIVRFVTQNAQSSLPSV